MSKLYIIEKDWHDGWESVGSSLIEAYTSQAKAYQRKEELEEAELSRANKATRCGLCAFDHYSDFVKNIRTFNHRAKSYCELADFRPERDPDDPNQYFVCVNKSDPYSFYNYYIRESELMDD